MDSEMYLLRRDIGILERRISQEVMPRIKRSEQSTREALNEIHESLAVLRSKIADLDERLADHLLGGKT